MKDNCCKKLQCLGILIIQTSNTNFNGKFIFIYIVVYVFSFGLFSEIFILKSNDKVFTILNKQ